MMIKQNIFSLTLLLGSLLTGGCVSTVDEPAADAAPISFATTMTRAAVDTDKKDMESFLVWGGFDSQNNLFNAETVTPQGYYDGTRYWVQDKTHNFYALHPASLKDKASCTEGSLITVTDFDTSQKRGTEAIDLMIASRTSIQYNAGETPSSVALSFGHELSRVKFSIQTEATVTLSNISLTGIAYKGTFSKEPNASGTWMNLTIADETDTPFKTVDGGTLTESTGSIDLLGGDLLLIPQDLTNAVFTMTWTYEDRTAKTFEVPLPEAGQKEWKRGISYHYSAVIPEQSSDIELTVSVGDWNDKKVNVDLQ